jgi:hypothetical protein
VNEGIAMADPQFVQVDKSSVYEVPPAFGRAWSGYLLAAGIAPQAGPIPLKKSYDAGPGAFPFGHYLFAQTRPAALDIDPVGFAQALQGMLVALNVTSSNRAIAWLRLIDGQLNAIANHLRFTQGLGAIWVNQVNLNIDLGVNFIFAVNVQASLGYDDGRHRLQAYTQTAQIVDFSSLDNNPSGLGITPNGAYFQAFLPLVGDQNGCFTMNATMYMPQAQTFFQTGLQFLHVAANSGDPAARMRFAIFKNPVGNRALLGAIDPLDRLNASLSDADLTAGLMRTGFVFADAAPLPSAFATVEGKPVSLVPQGGGSGLVRGAGGLAFVEYRTGGGRYYQLAPVGDYALAVAGVAPATPGQRLLPGLFGSEYITFTTAAAPGDDATTPDLLRWRQQQPAYAPIYPFEPASLDDPSSGALVARLVGSAPLSATESYPTRTSWASIVAGSQSAAIGYSAQPAGAPLYAASATRPAALPASEGADLLGSAPPVAAFPTAPDFAVPLAPFRGLDPTVSGADAGRFESQILSPTRKALITPYAKAAMRAHRAAASARAAPPPTITATTPQGLLAEVPADGHGAYRKVTLASPIDRATAPDFAFCSLTEALTDALQTNQLFLVAVNNAELGAPVSWRPGQPRTDCGAGDAAQFLNAIDIAGWTFVANVGQGALPTNYRNVLILKFCSGSLRERLNNPNQWSAAEVFSQLAGAGASGSFATLGLTGLATWLQAFVDDGIAKANGPDAQQAALYANFKSLMTDPNWNGFIVLEADLPLWALPAQIAGIGAGIDLQQFVGHHFGSTVSRIKSDNGALSIDGGSSLFGLIDYVDPRYAQNLASGAYPESPIPIAKANGYGFVVLQLQALFAQAKLKIFRSRIQLSLDALFGSPIVSTTFAGAGQAIPALVLDGSALTQNGQTVYVFEQTQRYVFIPDSMALNAIAVTRVQFNTLGVDADLRVNSRFLIWGNFDFVLMTKSASEGTAASPFDFLSFGSAPMQSDALGQGLAFANLQIQMSYDEAIPDVIDFTFAPNALAFDVASSQARADSLYNGFALQVTDFIAAPDGKKPADYGFLPVLPTGVAINQLQGPWYAIKYKLDMGGPGALVSAAGFSSSFATAWAPAGRKGSGFPQVFAGLSLPGAAPAASVFSLQGVLKLSTGPIKLDYALGAGSDKRYYTLALEDIGLKILGIVKLPPSANIKFFLFGDPAGKGSLGWWAAYVADDAGDYFKSSSQRLALDAAPAPLELEDLGVETTAETGAITDILGARATEIERIGRRHPGHHHDFER